LNCPNKPAHYLAGSLPEVQAFLRNFCESPNLADYLKRVWIRHQDVQRYQKIGINLFKISGRQINSKQLLGQLEYFLNDTYYQDSYIEYMYTKYGIKKNETELDEFFDFLFSKPGCTGRCTECGSCEQFAKKLLQE
jgi:hypothetical protein